MLGRKNRKRSEQLFYPSEAKIGKGSQQKETRHFCQNLVQHSQDPDQASVLDQVRDHLHPSPNTLRVQWSSLFIILSEVPISILAMLFASSLVCMDLLLARV
jgi:hypothetical protein